MAQEMANRFWFTDWDSEGNARFDLIVEIVSMILVVGKLTETLQELAETAALWDWMGLDVQTGNFEARLHRFRKNKADCWISGSRSTGGVNRF